MSDNPFKDDTNTNFNNLIQRPLIQDANEAYREYYAYESVRIERMQFVDVQVSRHVICSHLASHGFSPTHQPLRNTGSLGDRLVSSRVDIPWPGPENNSQEMIQTGSSRPEATLGPPSTLSGIRPGGRPQLTSANPPALEAAAALSPNSSTSASVTAEAAAHAATGAELECASCHMRVTLSVGSGRVLVPLASPPTGARATATDANLNENGRESGDAGAGATFYFTSTIDVQRAGGGGGDYGQRAMPRNRKTHPLVQSIRRQQELESALLQSHRPHCHFLLNSGMSVVHCHSLRVYIILNYT